MPKKIKMRPLCAAFFIYRYELNYICFSSKTKEIMISLLKYSVELNSTNQILICARIEDLSSHLSADESTFVEGQFDKKNDIVHLNRLSGQIWVYKHAAGEGFSQKEKARLAAHKVCKAVNSLKLGVVDVKSLSNQNVLYAFIEGLALSNYQFLKYYSDREERANSLSEINIVGLTENEVREVNNLVRATSIARDLVNEPLSYLTAEQYSMDMKAYGEEHGFSVEVFNKSKIEALKMGGLLAVNKGSVNPPTFNILEWKPSNARNSKPFVLVGKGVVYDTGGLSLKPTPSSMDYMKCDMGGSAAVVGLMCAIASNELPIHVIGLIPAAENRPGGNAYVPGDVINMYNGMTVEVLNTDAEGRMLMADALAYAQQYEPELVIDLATLTGSASRAIGDQAMISMGTAEQKEHDDLVSAGFETYERVVQFPFWDEYADQLKSKVADIKNLGGPEAGMITAGKFLEYFTLDKDKNPAYPYIHLDIAGVAYNHSEKSYRGVEGSGVGVRLLYEFFKGKSK